jgi:uncharacterized membrane protein YphA (DoxX/SURF4 family)
MAMLSFDSIPQARVVRKGAHVFAPPPVPRMAAEPGSFGEQARNALAVLVGLWPLTCVVLLAAGLMIMAGNNGGP